jgi:hypothetical protein
MDTIDLMVIVATIDAVTLYCDANFDTPRPAKRALSGAMTAHAERWPSFSWMPHRPRSKQSPPD